MSNPMGWPELLERWHDFFVLSGTAAVTLAGLLFVAISIHVETLVRARREHLLELARATLTTFVMVLVLSLCMLVPQLSERMAGFELLILGGLFFAMTLRLLIVTRIPGDADFSIGLFRRRLLLPAIGYLWVAVTGWLLWRGGSPYSLHYVIGGVCTLLGNASGTSWELLVRVARIRHSERESAVRAD